MNSKKIVIIYTLLILAMVFWGMSFVWYKQAFVYYRPISVILIRLVISVILLLPYALVTGRIKKLQQKHFMYFFLLALFEPFLYFVGESLGVQFVSATVAAVMISLIPLVTPVAAYLFYREKLFIRNIAGIIISFSGVLMVIYFSGNEFQSTWKGILLLLLPVLSTVGYALVVKKLSSYYNPLSILMYQNLIGIVYFIPVVWIFEKDAIMHATWKFQSLLPVLYLSFFASGLAYIFFIDGIRKIGMARAIVFTNFVPVFTALFAWYILHDTLTPFQIAGIILVIGGLFLSQHIPASRK